MPRKLHDEKLNEINSAAIDAYFWLENLPEFNQAWKNIINRKSSQKETAKYKSIFGFIPQKPCDILPLELIVVLQTIQRTPFNQESAILFDPMNYNLFERTRDGKLVDPNENIYDEPIGLPPKQISLLIYWDYPILDIMQVIEAIIKKIKYLHQVPDQRPRDKHFIFRICNKSNFYKNNRLPPEILTLKINWLLCPSVITKHIRPIIEYIKKKYKIKDSRPQYAKLADRYKVHVMTELGYPYKKIQIELLKNYSKTPGTDPKDHLEAFRKYVDRVAKKGSSQFLQT